MVPAIIPARGGSKGIVGKNLVTVHGKPLIVWTIEHALAASCVDSVVVATDSDMIADCARTHGAEVYRRTKASATDSAPSEVVLREVIVANGWRESEAIVFLQATSPLRQAEDIDSAFHIFRLSMADSLFSARLVHGYTWNSDGETLIPSYIRQPRQAERRKVYEENGSIYIFKPRCILRDSCRLSGKIVPFIMHPLDSFQIDEPEDIRLLETLMEVRLDRLPAKAD